MHRRALLAIAVLGGCGDNGSECGGGTILIDGVCVPVASIACGDGTKLESGQCVVDPEACQAGTVLIANRCVDPASDLVIDLEESVEPNALGIAVGVEASTAPAGMIALQPAGVPYVMHGRILPFRDTDADGQLDADFDSYVVTVAGPTLLEVTVDGVGGTQGAFYAGGDPAGAVPTFERYGLNLTGDTSRRKIFLPAAGRFVLAIADTRALAIGRNPPDPAGTGGAAGGPLAEYYATVTVVAMPSPTEIALTAGAGSHAGTLDTDEVELFSAALGSGVHDIACAMPGAPVASIAALDGFGGLEAQFEGYAEETQAPAQLAVAGGNPGGPTVIAVDAVYNYGPAPEPFTVTIAPR
jgi:hypothetical protein